MSLARIGVMMLPLLMLGGCCTRMPRMASDNTLPLLNHAEFKAAAQAAPNWASEALRTITRLETEVSNRGW